MAADDALLARGFGWGSRAELEPAGPTTRPAVLTVGHAADVPPEAIVVAVAGAASRHRGRVKLRLDSEVATPELLRALTTSQPIIELELHGPAAPPHEYLTRRRGSFKRTLQAAALARQAGMKVELRSAVTRPSFRLLKELAALALRLGASRWELFFPQPVAGDPASAVTSVVPRLSLVAGLALEALQLFRRGGQPAVLVGFPYCVVEDAALVEAGRRDGAELVGRCEGCRWAEHCPGVAPAYIATYDDLELVPVLESGPADELAMHEPQLPAHLLGSGVTRGLGRLAKEGAAPSAEEVEAVKQIVEGDSRYLNLRLRDETGAVPMADIERTLVVGRKAGARRLRLCGPDPLAHASWMQVLTQARLNRYVDIEVCTTGETIGGPRQSFKVVEAGAWRMTFTLYGGDAATHDAALQNPGAFEALRYAVKELRGRGFESIATHFWAGERNFGALLGAIAFARSEGILPMDGIVVEPGAFRLEDALAQLRDAAPSHDEADVTRALELLAPLARACLIERFFPGRGEAAAEAATAPYLQADDRDCPHKADCRLGSTCAGYSVDYRERYGPDEFAPLG